MKTKILFIAISLFYFSCSNDEAATPQEPDPVDEIVQPIIAQPVIFSLSTNFIIQGKSLIIEGTNFINNDFETKLIINNETYDVTPVSNSQIIIDISNSMGVENSSVFVKISDKVSEFKNFFIIPKGWYQIETNLEILKAFIFDNTNAISMLIDTGYDGALYGAIKKIYGTENGYHTSVFIPSGSKSDLVDLIMFNKDVGVAVNDMSGYFTTDSFETSKSFGNFYDDGEYMAMAKIKYVDANSSVIVNCCSAHIYTNDKGNSYSNSKALKELHLNTRIYGKGSDNYFYELGLYLSTKQYVMRSANGFDNWELLNNNNDYSLGFQPYFYDFDLIFTKSRDDELLISNDLGDTWNINKNNVQSYFIKDRTNWFIVSDNKLYSTIDAGTSWSLELELPINSEINYMHFSSNKSIIAGKNILYIKHH